MISADHPDLDKDRISNILMAKHDQDLLTEVCRDPISSETMCKYAAYLATDVASHRKAMHGLEESQIVGRIIEREVPINSYHIRHAWMPTEGEQPDKDNYIGMPIPVSFDKNIGMKKQANPNLIYSNGARLITRCKCGQTDCECAVGRGLAKKYIPTTQRLQSKDINAQKMNQRRELYKKYTKVDPEAKDKVQKQIEKGTRRINKSKEKYFEPKKYVIEQIASQGNIGKSQTIRATHMISIDDTTDRLARIKPITPSRDSMMTRQRAESSIEPSTKIPVLEEMVELMDMYLRGSPQYAKKPAPTASTNHMSIQTDPEDDRSGQRRVQPATVPLKAQPKISTKSNSDYKVIIAKQSRVMKEPSSHKRIVKVVNRHYELDTDSFEISELIQHVPSRVISLESPVVKQSIDIEADDNLPAIDRSKYTAARGELVDINECEVEKRKMIERIVDDFEVPVFARK